MIKYNIWKRKPTVVVTTSHWHRAPHTLERFNSFLEKKKFNDGDILTYFFEGEKDAKNILSFSVVLAVETDFQKVHWPSYEDDPCIYKLVGLSGVNGNTDPYFRWSNAEHMRYLTDKEKELIDDNVQNHIKEVTAKYKDRVIPKSSGY